jgi:SagB-type dehydrogenase family enzyme
MLPKFTWVLAPLAMYAIACAILAWRGRAPSRLALNVHISLLLLAYLLGTAGLGIFWVANQQLPVFDWHYLFGYATLLLVSLHLVFNLPVVVRWFDKRRGSAALVRSGSPCQVAKIAGLALALAASFYIGTRQTGGDIRVDASPGQEQFIARYHAFSSESRASVFQRAPGVAWGDAPPAFKEYPGAPQVLLEKGQPGTLTLAQLLAERGPGARLTVAALGRMLYLSSGITLRRGGNALRAAPSSGALFPSELYVAARRIEGLPTGLYHYDPQQHRLHLLGPLPAAIGAPHADDAEALVLLSAVFRRTGYKYHNRAYRYALADAGHLLENVRLAAHGAGLSAQLLRAFDDTAAASALGIDGVEEGVLAIMPLRQSAQPGLPALPDPQFVPVAHKAGTAIGVTGLAQQATSLHLPPPPDGIEIDLPAPVAASRELFATIVQRRSQRRFSPDPLPLALLSGVLADLRQAPQLYAAIDITIVANRVTGLAPGVYRYLPRHALRLVRAGEHADQAQSAALAQDVIGDAAAVLVLSSERDRVLAGGARSYRHALIETGMIGERWLLGAVARGLAACPVGAFYDDEAAILIGADSARHWVFHFAALGLPAGP